MEEEGFDKKGSLSSSSSWPSRLSPLAQPFTMKRQASQSRALNSLTNSNPSKPFAPSTSKHLDPIGDSFCPNPFSNATKDDQLFVSSDSALSESTIPFDDQNPSFSQYESGFFQGFCCPSSSIDEAGLDSLTFASKSSVCGHTQSSSNAGGGRTNHGEDSISINEAGSSAVESFLKNDSKVTPSKVSPAPALFFSSTLHKIAPMSGSSITDATFSPPTHTLSNTAALIENSFASNRDGSYGWNIMPNADSKEVHQDKDPVHKSNETKVKLVSGKGLDPLAMAKSGRKVTSEDVLRSLALKNSGIVTGVSTKNSPKMLNEDEDDLDSPCWKGIQNSGKSSGKVSEGVCSNFRNNSETGLSLNPKAPQFFPSHAKGIMDYSQNNFLKDGFTSFREGDYPTFSPSPQDELLADFHKVGPKPPGFSRATGYQHSNKIHERRKESLVLKNSKTSSAFNLPQMANSCCADGILPEINFEGSAKGAIQAMHNSPEFFPTNATNNKASVSSSGVGAVNAFRGTLQCLYQTLSNCPNISISMMVKAMHYLSESLVQNYADDLDSLNGQDHEILHNIIDNLYALIKRRIAGKSTMLGGPHTDSLNYRDKSTAIHELSNMDSEAPRSKHMVAHCELDSLSNHRWGGSCSHVSAMKLQDLVSSSRDTCFEAGIGVIPVPMTALNETQTDEGVQPQALLNLWIEAQAALCSMKYENHILRMKLKKAGR